MYKQLMLRNNLDKPNDDIKEETECQSKLEHNYAMNSNNVQVVYIYVYTYTYRHIKLVR